MSNCAKNAFSDTPAKNCFSKKISNFGLVTCLVEPRVSKFSKNFSVTQGARNAFFNYLGQALSIAESRSGKHGPGKKLRPWTFSIPKIFRKRVGKKISIVCTPMCRWAWHAVPPWCQPPVTYTEPKWCQNGHKTHYIASMWDPKSQHRATLVLRLLYMSKLSTGPVSPRPSPLPTPFLKGSKSRCRPMNRHGPLYFRQHLLPEWSWVPITADFSPLGSQWAKIPW